MRDLTTAIRVLWATKRGDLLADGGAIAAVAVATGIGGPLWLGLALIAIHVASLVRRAIVTVGQVRESREFDEYLSEIIAEAERYYQTPADDAPLADVIELPVTQPIAVV